MSDYLKKFKDVGGPLYLYPCPCISLAGSGMAFPNPLFSFLVRLRDHKMSSLGHEFGRSFARETWALYAVGMLGVALRL